MIEIIIGAASGCVGGFGMGLLVAVATRDGIWPTLWVILVMASTMAGALLGALNWMLS
jgi:cytochrome c biogenesis protein CcdA